MPVTALTVGIGTIMDADEILIIVSGKNKAKALYRAVEGSVSHTCPLSALQLHQRAVIVCDEGAASALSGEAVRYFKQLEPLYTIDPARKTIF